jgi:CDP-diacylglycerol--glycerol-3-phosphate 3-phosphatidyltransferase
VVPLLWIAYYGHPVIAFLIYIVACFTDWLDGYLARRRNIHEPNGKRLDEISDKVLVLGVVTLLFTFEVVRFSPDAPMFWVFGVLILRECIITSMRTVWPDRAQRVPVLYSAKAKTVFTMTGLGLFMLAGTWHPTLLLVAEVGVWLLILAVLTSIWSGSRYVWHFTRRT